MRVSEHMCSDVLIYANFLAMSFQCTNNPAFVIGSPKVFIKIKSVSNPFVAFSIICSLMMSNTF